MPELRLQKLLSQAGVASRRKAEQLILAGNIRVNGKVIRTLGVKVHYPGDLVEVHGKPITVKDFHEHYLYYKPSGWVVSKQDELGRKTIFDKLKLNKRVNTAGRLDKESEGLLILSSDGELIKRLTHPRYGIRKTYYVQLDHNPDASVIQQLTQGILLEDKLAHAFDVALLKKSEFHLKLSLEEGRNREVRKLMELLGYEVTRLLRVKHGVLELGDLEPGDIQPLTAAQEKLLYESVQLNGGLDHSIYKSGSPSSRG